MTTNRKNYDDEDFLALFTSKQITKKQYLNHLRIEKINDEKKVMDKMEADERRLVREERSIMKDAEVVKPDLVWNFGDNTLLLLAMAAKVLDISRPKVLINNVEEFNPYIEETDGAKVIRAEINNSECWTPETKFYSFSEGLALVSKYVNVITEGGK